MGDGQFDVASLASIESASVKDVTFVLEKKYKKQAETLSCMGLISVVELTTSTPYILVNMPPRKALARTIDLVCPPKEVSPENTPISSSAKVDETVVLGHHVVIGAHTQVESGTVIGANVVIGSRCKIGKNCRLYPGVVLYDHVEIGDNVILHSHATIGADGFGFYLDEGKWNKIRHIGSVKIGSYVEIGANSTVDRGCLGSTVILDGTKIDNLVQIAHNTHIGHDTVIAAQAGIVGRGKIGNYVQLGGQVGVSDVSVGDYAIVASKAGVTKNIPEKSVVSGF